MKVPWQLGRCPSAFIPLEEVRAVGMVWGGRIPPQCGADKERFLHLSWGGMLGRRLGWGRVTHPVAAEGGGCLVLEGGGSSCVVSTPAFSCPESLPCLCLSFPTRTNATVFSPCCKGAAAPVLLHPPALQNQKSPGLPSPILAPAVTVPDGSPFDRDSAGVSSPHRGWRCWGG